MALQSEYGFCWQDTGQANAESVSERGKWLSYHFAGSKLTIVQSFATKEGALIKNTTPKEVRRDEVYRKIRALLPAISGKCTSTSRVSNLMNLSFLYIW